MGEGGRSSCTRSSPMASSSICTPWPRRAFRIRLGLQRSRTASACTSRPGCDHRRPSTCPPSRRLPCTPVACRRPASGGWSCVQAWTQPSVCAREPGVPLQTQTTTRAASSKATRAPGNHTPSQPRPLKARPTPLARPRIGLCPAGSGTGCSVGVDGRGMRRLRTRSPRSGADAGAWSPGRKRGPPARGPPGCCSAGRHPPPTACAGRQACRPRRRRPRTAPFQTACVLPCAPGGVATPGWRRPGSARAARRRRTGGCRSRAGRSRARCCRRR